MVEEKVRGDDVTIVKTRHNDHVDAGYAWVIVACSFVLQVRVKLTLIR